MADPNESFYRPVKWHKAESQEQRILEIRQQMARMEEPIIEMGPFGPSIRRPVARQAGHTTLETEAYLRALGCEPYQITPTHEEWEILEIERLFELKKEANEPTNKRAVPETTQSSDSRSGRGCNACGGDFERRPSEQRRPGSCSGD